jgi:hypothetical protein
LFCHVRSRTIKYWKDHEMRNILKAAAAGVFLTLGAAGVANAGQPNPNVPSWSPYAIGGYEGATESLPRRPMHRMTSEGRAAYVKPAQPNDIFSDGSSDAKHMFTPDSMNDSGNAPGGIKNEEPMADR